MDVVWVYFEKKEKYEAQRILGIGTGQF